MNNGVKTFKQMKLEELVEFDSQVHDSFAGAYDSRQLNPNEKLTRLRGCTEEILSFAEVSVGIFVLTEGFIMSMPFKDCMITTTLNQVLWRTCASRA